MDFERILHILRALSEHRVEYVLVGGVAVNLHGLQRATEDIDLFVRAEATNVERLKAALATVFDDPLIDEITVEDLGGDYPTIRYVPPDGDLFIDIISRLGDAVRFEELESEEIEVEGVTVRIATPRCLFRMKRDTIRFKDRADAENLKAKFSLEDH